MKIHRPLKRLGHMRSSKRDNLLLISPNQRAGSVRSYFGNGRPKFAHQPTRITRATNAGLRRVAEPTNATSLSMATEPTGNSIRRIEVIVEPVYLTPQLTSLPALKESFVSKNLKGTIEKAKLRAASCVAHRNYKSNIHLHFPRNARAYLLLMEKVRSIAPQARLGACGWFWDRDVRNEKHVALENRLRRLVSLSRVGGVLQYWKNTQADSMRVVLHNCVCNGVVQ